MNALLKKIYVIPGEEITSLESFYKVMGKVVNDPGGYFGGNLDGIEDCLYGGFGTPDEGCIFHWQHSDVSRHSLGYEETARWLHGRIKNGHPANQEHFAARLREAQHGLGETLFDTILKIFRSNASGVATDHGLKPEADKSPPSRGRKTGRWRLSCLKGHRPSAC